MMPLFWVPNEVGRTLDATGHLSRAHGYVTGYACVERRGNRGYVELHVRGSQRPGSVLGPPAGYTSERDE